MIRTSHQMKHPLLETLVHVLLPLFVGTLIYTLWRSQKLLVFRWYEAVHLGGAVKFLRHATWGIGHGIPKIVIYSLPDGIWVYSFTTALLLLWSNDSNSVASVWWLLLPSSMAVAAEVGQAAHLVPGTFDWLDILCYLIAGFLGVAIPNNCSNLKRLGKRLRLSAVT